MAIVLNSFFPLFVLLDNHLCGTITVHIIDLTDFQNQILNSSTVYIAGMLCKDEQYWLLLVLMP